MGHLSEAADKVVVAVELERGAEDVEIGERVEVGCEIGVIIPIDEIIGHVEPRLDARSETLVAVDREPVVAPERRETYAAVVS